MGHPVLSSQFRFISRVVPNLRRKRRKPAICYWTGLGHDLLPVRGDYLKMALAMLRSATEPSHA